MQGSRGPKKVWTIDNKQQNLHSLDLVIDDPIISKRIKSYTGSLFSPTLSTLAKSILVGHLTTFPSFITK